MKYIRSILHFLNEGAKLSPPYYDNVDLTWEDDPNDSLEVLKTNDSHKITRVLSNSGKTSYTIYYGLNADPSRIEKLNKRDPILKHTMDLLKDARIDLKDLMNFTKNTAQIIEQDRGSIDYIVPLGSRKGLSYELAQAFSSHFPGAKVISLKKQEYENVSKAIDWDYIYRYFEESERLREKNKENVALKWAKDLIIKEIDKEKTSSNLINKIRGASDVYELRAILTRANLSNRYGYREPIYWKKGPYKIATSNLTYGGSRRAFKTKYETPKEYSTQSFGEFGDQSFVDALVDCMVNKKKMLYVDDNTRTKEDLRQLFAINMKMIEKRVPEIRAEGMIDPKDLEEEELSKRFMAYVLIYVPTVGNLGIANFKSSEELNQFTRKEVYVKNIEDWKEEEEKRISIERRKEEERIERQRRKEEERIERQRREEEERIERQRREEEEIARKERSSKFLEKERDLLFSTFDKKYKEVRQDQLLNNRENFNIIEVARKAFNETVEILKMQREELRPPKEGFLRYYSRMLAENSFFIKRWWDANWQIPIVKKEVERYGPSSSVTAREQWFKAEMMGKD